MSEFKLMCEKFFGSTNFYDILNIKSDATEKEIKKAYHKLSLCVHPDRVEEDQKKIATEKFQVLGKIHSILQDKAKRQLYDDAGEFDEDLDSSFNWMDYWQSIFKKIEIKDIENYEKKYIGSETELRDIKKAYVSSKGNMDKILEMVPFSNCDSEGRFIEIVQKMVDNGEVERYEAFFNENKSKKTRRHKKWQKEKQEAELIDMKELEKDLERNRRSRGEQFCNFLTELENVYGSKSGKRKMAIESPALPPSKRVNKKRKTK